MSTADDTTAVSGLGQLDQTDLALAKLLSRGASYDEAGAVLGISKSSVYRRMADPLLRRQVDHERAVGVDDVLRALTSAGERAVRVLEQIMLDDGCPAMTRLKAASGLLGHLSRWKGQEQLPLTGITPEEARRILIERLMKMRDGAASSR